MKWGQHIFTNPDGSPKNPKEADEAERDIESAFEGVGKATQNAANATRTLSRKKPSKEAKERISKMSDKELRDAVNRMDLEKRYADLSGETTRKGMDEVTAILTLVGSAAGIVGGIAKTAYYLNKIKG